MSDRELGRIARWTETGPRSSRDQYHVVYREYIAGAIYEYRGKGDSRAIARQALAEKFHAVWGFYPSGYVEPVG